MIDYKEPELSVLVLDFQKPQITRACLESIRRVQFPVKVIYLHNGPSDYAYGFYKEGLVDQFIQSRVNNGLGVGTRDLVASCFSPYFMMLQNDQVIARDFSEQEFDAVKKLIGQCVGDEVVASVGLAGPVGGNGVYSERCHIMRTEFYKVLERSLPLSCGGAGPYHHMKWREGQIQQDYLDQSLTHYTNWPLLVRDCGVWTIRDCAGGRVYMRTDTKAIWWEKPPTEPYVFPELTPQEWATSIAGNWVGGTVPEIYRTRNGGNESFECWGKVETPF